MKNYISKNWNVSTAMKIAQKENIILTIKHWEIIFIIREYYDKFKIIPPSRMLLKIMKEKIGIKNSNSQYLLSLFPKGISKQANKIAGLPKSNICL